MARHKVTPFIWFQSQAEEAANLYVSLFPNSRIDKVTRNPDGGAFVVEFTLDGVPYIALNGGPHYVLNEAFSLSVHCEEQSEIDSLWEKLTQGGGIPGRCGWLKDRFGLSWQIVPSFLTQLLSDPARSQSVMKAMMAMTKMDIRTLKEAADRSPT